MRLITEVESLPLSGWPILHKPIPYDKNEFFDGHLRVVRFRLSCNKVSTYRDYKSAPKFFMSKFTTFHQDINEYFVPSKFTLMEDGKPDAICVAAAEDLQQYLLTQRDWEHNFGLKDGQEGMVVGKMFGVLVVKTHNGELGYLSAFSGKLAGVNQHERFVPPIYDLLEEGNFFNTGMQELTRMNSVIKALEVVHEPNKKQQIQLLKLQRKNHSVALQQQIFDQYRFVNKAGKEKALCDLFCLPQHKNPPAGAGECAGPKLLQYAFQHKMESIALAEFWWGQSPKSANWKHGEYYACCKEKCGPILGFMLSE